MRNAIYMHQDLLYNVEGGGVGTSEYIQSLRLMGKLCIADQYVLAPSLQSYPCAVLYLAEKWEGRSW